MMIYDFSTEWEEYYWSVIEGITGHGHVMFHLGRYLGQRLSSLSAMHLL